MLLLKSVIKPQIFLTALFILLTSKVSAQDSKELRFASCPVDDCVFTIQFEDGKEPEMIFKIHLLTKHNIKSMGVETAERVLSDFNKEKRDKTKFIECPFGDNLKIWSADESELIFWFKGHFEVVHNKDLSEEAIKEIIEN